MEGLFDQDRKATNNGLILKSCVVLGRRKHLEFKIVTAGPLGPQTESGRENELRQHENFIVI